MQRRAAGDDQDTLVLQGRSSVDLIRAQNSAGHKIKELGSRFAELRFEASGPGGVRAVMDGFQQLQSVEVPAEAREEAGGEKELEQWLLTAMQEAHDKSYEATQKEVWELYRDNPALLQAPFSQIGIGGQAQDLWVNVTKTDETVGMAQELFRKFDVDGDGYWNLKETAAVQAATEGTEIAEDQFNALVIAAAPNGGRDLTEEELAKGLSEEKVVELYTDAAVQRRLGFVLNVRKDHGTIFNEAPAEVVAESSTTSEVAAVTEEEVAAEAAEEDAEEAAEADVTAEVAAEGDAEDTVEEAAADETEAVAEGSTEAVQSVD